MGDWSQHPDCGHLCCDTRPDPFHDHFLDAAECPRCKSAEKAQKLLAAVETENVIGYVVVAREGRHAQLPDSEGWTFVDGRYGRLVDAHADARHLNGKVADMQFRVAELVLLPEEA